jgi:beta-lactamase regulating signal transducer with metallopeptidase domain
MNTMVQAISENLQASGLLALFLDALLKGFVILALAGIGCVVWRRGSAAARHLVWFVALLSLPCLVLLSFLPRSWQKPLWSLSTSFDSGNQVSLTMAPVRNPGAWRIDGAETAATTRVSAASLRSQSSTNGGQPGRTRFSTIWVVCGFAVWCGGVVVGFVSVLASQFRLKELSRCARVLRPSGSGPRLLPESQADRHNVLGSHSALGGCRGLESPRAEWAGFLNEACEKLHLRRRVALLESARHTMPVTWGWWRPVILLPAEASRWEIERQRVVLLHELAHVKRWDCLTQMAARVICHLFWVNPMAWLALRRMCAERERACDDLVLNGGWKPSDYAKHLLEVARSLALAPQTAAIAMARSSQLEARIAAIVDASRPRRMRPVTAISVVALMACLILAFGGNGREDSRSETEESIRLRDEQVIQLEAFAVAKEKQSKELAAKAGETISPEIARFFDAATRGDWETVTNMYQSLHNRHPQYDHGTNAPDLTLHTAYWSPVLELCLAYDHLANCEPKYTALLVEGIMSSIPAGAIYFGGTDPGRGIPTAFSRSHADGDPFFTLTQNALADGTYLDYLRAMYGGKIYTPSGEDSQKCFNEYLNDAQRRLHHDLQFPNEAKRVRPGEDIKEVDGRMKVAGQVAVMSINARMVKVIFDRNPGRDFYLEESYPLDWMYPHLQPHGLIMRINREPLPEMSQTVLAEDHEYWSRLASGMLGDLPAEGTSVRELTDFVERVSLRHDLDGFTGDTRFVQNDYAKRLFSKLRSSIGGVYAWRASQPGTAAADKVRMTREADFAFREAFALCPYSPEAVNRYVNLLVSGDRRDDALLIATTASKVDPKNSELRVLVKNLKEP